VLISSDKNKFVSAVN